MAKNNESPQLDIVGSVDDIFRSRGYGDRSRIYHESTFGFDFNAKGATVSLPRNNAGIVFFTRPRLNLTYDNLSKAQALLSWRDVHPDSILGITRCFLDPDNQRLKPRNIVKDRQGIYYDPNNPQFMGFDSMHVDPRNPFITMLTNDLLGCSGWPDIRLDYYASDKGIRGEQWIMADGLADIYGAYSLDCTFQNKTGDAIYLLFQLWALYQSYLLTDLDPYPEMIARRMIDYNTRIYSFTLDNNRKYLNYWAQTGAGFPTNNSTGAPHNYDSSEGLKRNLDSITIQFQNVGALYNNIKTLYFFNKTVAMYNPGLQLDSRVCGYRTITEDGIDNIPAANKGDNDSKNAVFLKLEEHEKPAANYHAYPLINLMTKELEWWIHRNDWIDIFLNRPDGSAPIGDPEKVGLGKNKKTFIPGSLGQPEINNKTDTRIKDMNTNDEALDVNRFPGPEKRFGGGTFNGGGAGGFW